MVMESGESAARVDAVCATQNGVIARWQVVECGESAAFIRRKLRRREWATVYRGVFVDHTGPLTWRQRAWAAVVAAFPAALSHESALHDEKVPSSGPVHIMVDRHRRVIARPGVVVHYGSRLDERVLWHTQPPRVRIEEAVLDVAADASSMVGVVGCLTDVLGARKTTADRLRTTLHSRRTMPRRTFIDEVLRDIRDGSCSVLEYEYLRKVERAHALPAPRRQAPIVIGRRGLRDVEYRDWGVVVELDGRAWHDGPAARDRDLERDLDAAVGATRQTLRIGWGQVFDRPCVTARKVGEVLRAHGWDGTPVRCPACPGLP
ncbi:MAG: hypothetical protein QM673_03800 [Gordonia sp. (in: high G+C Gram-positive bacteria)]